MKTYTLPEESLNKFLNYLATRPYAEVFQLVAELQANAKEMASTDAPTASATDARDVTATTGETSTSEAV